MKAGGAIVSVLPGAKKKDDDLSIISNLIWALEHARREKVEGFALMVLMEREDQTQHFLKTLAVRDGGDLHAILGGVEMLGTLVRARIIDGDN